MEPRIALINYRASREAVEEYKRSGPQRVEQMLLSRPWYFDRAENLYSDYAGWRRRIGVMQREQCLEEDQMPSFRGEAEMPVKIKDVYTAVARILAGDYLKNHPDFPNAQVLQMPDIEHALRQTATTDKFRVVTGGFALDTNRSSGRKYNLPDMFLVDEYGRILAMDECRDLYHLRTGASRDRIRSICRTFLVPESASALQTAFDVVAPGVNVERQTLDDDQFGLVALNIDGGQNIHDVVQTFPYGQVIPTNLRARGALALKAIRHIGRYINE